VRTPVAITTKPAAAAAPDGTTLGFAEARVSPCATCDTSPCCRYLPLHTFPVKTLLDLDHVAYLLNFDHIRVGVGAHGEWSVYYQYPCRFLSPDDASCTVHDTPDQPRICVHYNPYSCWYRHSLPGGDADFVVVDRPRFEQLLNFVEFDANRVIVATPAFDELARLFEDLPLEPDPTAFEAPPADGARAEWQAIALGEKPAELEVVVRGYDDPAFDQPCESCAAPCCSTLIFPFAGPTSASNLDFLRFCLGFPGIEAGVSDEGWSLVVKTACRHFANGRCSVFGEASRPLLCSYYDEWKCNYRWQFGDARPAGFVRVTLEDFPAVASAFRFADGGAVVDALDTEELRVLIEQGWRQTATPWTSSPA
jgi:hypothetical protein